MTNEVVKDGCDRCGFIIDAVEQSYSKTGEGFRLNKVDDELRKLRNRLQAIGVCVPLCMPALKIMSKWKEFNEKHPLFEEK